MTARRDEHTFSRNLMPAFLTGIFSVLGSFVTGIFNFKGEQAKTVQSSIDLLKSINDGDSQSQVATAQALQVILSQGSWLEKQWRPFLMVLLMVIIGSWFFGYVPPHFNDPVSPMMQEVITLLKIGVGGYIPCRTIEKVITTLNISSILKEVIKKKIL